MTVTGPVNGHSHPMMEYEIVCELKLTGSLAKRLVESASKMNVKPVDLLSDIIETVLKDDLISAVLDR